MILFAPDLVIISAGFDAHDEDPLANVELLDEDFQWATEIVMQACVTINPDKPVPGEYVFFLPSTFCFYLFSDMILFVHTDSSFSSHPYYSVFSIIYFGRWI